MTLISQVDVTAITSKVIPENDRRKLKVVQDLIKNLLAAPAPAAEVEEDEDDLDQPARKRIKTTNGTTHQDEDATMLL